MRETIVLQNDIRSNIENISLIARNALTHISIAVIVFRTTEYNIQEEKGKKRKE